MESILVSIISDQTIPNLLIIKELSGLYDRQVFISTPRMEKEGKSRWIENAASVAPGTTERIVVDENNWTDINEKLTNFNWPENAEYAVNLTGGTKVMTLAIYQYFAKPASHVIYVPIGKNCYEELYPNKNSLTVPIETRLNVKEYLIAHGISYTQKTEFKKRFDELKKIFKSYKNKGYNIDNLFDGYPAEWKNYFTGEWFEEYLFYFIKKDLTLDQDDIVSGVKLNHNENQYSLKNDQELDIVFTRNNELYILEAKVSIGRKDLKKDLLYQIMFKLSAVNKNFGLRSHPYVVTMANTEERSKDFQTDLLRKARVLGIKKIVDRNDLNNRNFSFKQII
ncbi:MAG: DUF1887 family protein [Mariniphaga sp.]|nr:DUF1887 family protein [Mariniphaga sp.]